MSPANLATKAFLQAYREASIVVPRMFLQSFFGKNSAELTISEKTEVEIDIVRSKHLVAKDVARGGTSVNTNKIPKFSNKTYKPPLYNEETPITAGQLNQRMAGRNPYQDLTPRESAFLSLGTEAQMLQTEKILRSKELQASEALFNGTLTFQETESIDFARKSTHNITPAPQWTPAAGNPIADLGDACDVVQVDGKTTPDMAIFGRQAWVNFATNVTVLNYTDKRRWNSADISPSVDPLNATFQGIMYIEDWLLELWTYPAFFEDETGATRYVPEKEVVVMNSGARLDKIFAAVELLPESIQAHEDVFGNIIMPNTVPGEFVPYHYAKPPQASFVGVQSAPLLVPTAIDTIARIYAVA